MHDKDEGAYWEGRKEDDCDRGLSRRSLRVTYYELIDLEIKSDDKKPSQKKVPS